MNRLRLAYALPVAGAGLAADQLAKLFVRASLPVCRQFPIVDCAHTRLGPITVVRVQNSGTGYLFLRSPAVALGLGIAGCFLVVVYAGWLRRVTWVAVAGVGLQAAGALSNVLDRLLVGGANDYVNVTPRFTFNLADLLLLAGMVLAVASIARRVASG
jgi:lipoprotein signal peptidase